MMKSRNLRVVYFVATLAICAHGRDREEDKKPIVLTQQTASTQIFSPDDLKQLAGHDATLRAIDLRLGGIDGKVTNIQTTFDKDVLPTIHVIDFLKWLLALVIAVIVGEWIKSLWKKKAEPTSH